MNEIASGGWLGIHSHRRSVVYRAGFPDRSLGTSRHKSRSGRMPHREQVRCIIYALERARSIIMLLYGATVAGASVYAAISATHSHRLPIAAVFRSQTIQPVPRRPIPRRQASFASWAGRTARYLCSLYGQRRCGVGCDACEAVRLNPKNDDGTPVLGRRSGKRPIGTGGFSKSVRRCA
jgi:hypothetical protein